MVESLSEGQMGQLDRTDANNYFVLQSSMKVLLHLLGKRQSIEVQKEAFQLQRLLVTKVSGNFDYLSKLFIEVLNSYCIKSFPATEITYY